jgi:hypothetical protein
MSANLIVDVPRVHMAGTSGLHDAHIEIGAHGFALFLSPDAPLPVLDIEGSGEQLRDFVDRLSAALRDRQAASEQLRRQAWEFSS